MVITKMFEPGTYGCQWSYRGQWVAGELRVAGAMPPAGEVFAEPDRWKEPVAGLQLLQPHEEVVDKLRGRTWRGEDVVLLDVRIVHRLPDTCPVRSWMALIGHTVPEDLLFDSLSFQVGGLTELSGVRPFKDITIPRSLHGDPQAIATWNSAASQKWTTAEGDELQLNFTGTVDYADRYRFSFSAAPVVKVSGTPRSVEDWMSQYVHPLAEITTFATLRAQAVSWAVVRRGKNGPPVQVFAADIGQQPYDAAPTQQTDRISVDSSSLIRLGADGATLPDLLAGWQSLRTKYELFFAYLTIALRDTMSTRSRFLALVPALEGLHLVDYGDGPMPRPEYKRQRKAVISRLAALEGVDQQDVEFIMTWLAPYGSHQLVHRLHEIRDKQLGDELRRRIQARVEPLPDVLHGLVDGATDIWAVMGTARNRIAHGAKNLPSDAQLDALTRLAHTVAIGVALRRLGVPDSVLCDAIDQGRWSVL